MNCFSKNNCLISIRLINYDNAKSLTSLPSIIFTLFCDFLKLQDETQGLKGQHRIIVDRLLVKNHNYWLSVVLKNNNNNLVPKNFSVSIDFRAY